MYQWSDNRKYDGQWIRNRMHGVGLFSWVDDRSYEGEYKNDQKDSFGGPSWELQVKHVYIVYREHMYNVFKAPLTMTTGVNGVVDCK